MMLNREILAVIGKHLTIVHHVPGRIRFRINPGILSHANSTDFESIIASIDGIESARLNRTVGTVVIHYNSYLLPPELWAKWVDGANLEEVYNIVSGQQID